jgi:hypothetical protein
MTGRLGLAGTGALAVLAIAACGGSSKVEQPRGDQIPAEQRAWGWTAAHKTEAERIFRRDPAVKDLFAHRRWMIVNSGPWNAERSTKVIGGTLKVKFAKPVHGIYRLPGITSYKTLQVKLFPIGAGGATEFAVDVLFKPGRVAQVSPLEEGRAP